MVDAAIYMTGAIVWTFVGVVMFGLALIGAGMLVNRAVRAMLDCYGGFKTLKEYIRWYRMTHKKGDPDYD